MQDTEHHSYGGGRGQTWPPARGYPAQECRAVWGPVIPVPPGRGAAVGAQVLQAASPLVPPPAGRSHGTFSTVFSPALERVPITTRIQAGPRSAAHMLRHHPQLAQGTALLSNTPGTPSHTAGAARGRQGCRYTDIGHRSETCVLPSSAPAQRTASHPQGLLWAPAAAVLHHTRGLSAGSHVLPPGR